VPSAKSFIEEGQLKGRAAPAEAKELRKSCTFAKPLGLKLLVPSSLRESRQGAEISRQLAFARLLHEQARRLMRSIFSIAGSPSPGDASHDCR